MNARQSVNNFIWRKGKIIKDNQNWQTIARPNLQRVQLCIAKLLYRFIVEVSNVEKQNAAVQSQNSNAALKIIFGTGTADKAGTHNRVYFGVELYDGRLMEFPLNNGAEIKKNAYYTYNLQLTQCIPEDVRKVWIWKDKKSTSMDDLLSLRSITIEVRLDGKEDFDLSWTIYDWIVGNSGFYADINVDETITRPGQSLVALYHLQGPSAVRVYMAKGDDLKNISTADSYLTKAYAFADSDFDVTDATGNGYHGTLTGDWVDGIIDGGVECDYSSEKIELTNSIDLDTTWAIEAWFKYPLPGIGGGDGVLSLQESLMLKSW